MEAATPVSDVSALLIQHRLLQLHCNLSMLYELIKYVEIKTNESAIILEKYFRQGFQILLLASYSVFRYIPVKNN